MFKTTEISQSPLPLGSISAVVLDTETTGLATNTDRIVQIGAVRIEAGRADDEDVFDVLVNPGVPIPAASTAIHGIHDRDVAGESGFVDVMPAFADWAGGSLLLGYSLGFDLAVLQAEHRRAGLPWQPPRTLDIAHLVQLVAPQLPSTGMDADLAWLGIQPDDRHRALGDARLAAEIFLALLPKLKAKGIATLAEAERACRTLTSRAHEEAEAGWHPVALREDESSARGGITRSVVDSVPYRFRLRDIMTSPPAIEAGAITVEAALTRIMGEKISSIFMTADESNDGYGILTERDILRAIDKIGPDALTQPAASFATRPLVSLDQDEFLYRAARFMASSGFRHLGVTGEDGALVGAISARDLLRQRADEIITLGDDIADARSAAELGKVWGGLAAVAGTLINEDIDARDIAEIISSELQALTRRACEIAEAELLESGKGAPPTPYAMLVLGSGGRGESLLAMDQDNAIIYREGEPGSATDQWFEALGQRAAAILNEAGVAFCKGGVMASNAAWRMDAAHWRRAVVEWLNVSSPDNILSADIFFDGRPVHGAVELGDALMRDAREAAKRSPAFIAALSQQAADFEMPIGWFGRFKTKEGRVDLKKGGLMALFSTARVLALKFDLEDRSTRSRFLAARDPLDMKEQTVGNLVEAHRLLLDTILRQQLRDLDRGLPLSNSIKPSELTSLQRDNLKWALDQIPETASLLGTLPKI
ncbi:MAG: DUF294 nucleotidyltransferase-like domain-containing protein [Geminicoccaceae bacterium]